MKWNRGKNTVTVRKERVAEKTIVSPFPVSLLPFHGSVALGSSEEPYPLDTFPVEDNPGWKSPPPTLRPSYHPFRLFLIPRVSSPPYSVWINLGYHGGKTVSSLTDSVVVNVDLIKRDSDKYPGRHDTPHESLREESFLCLPTFPSLTPPVASLYGLRTPLGVSCTPADLFLGPGLTSWSMISLCSEKGLWTERDPKTTKY